MSASFQTVMEAAWHYGGMMLVHGTVLALATAFLAVTVFRRTRPAFRAALWVIVLIKFLVPPVLPGEMALSSWIARISNSVTADRTIQQQPQLTTSVEAGAAQSIEARTGSENFGARFLFSGYLVLLFLLTARSLWTLVRTSRQIRRLPLVGSDLQTEVRLLSARIGIKHAPVVKCSEDNLTPYIFGFWRPVMVLPRALIHQLEPGERCALILHELAHVRRKDVLVRLLQGTARIFFFFFPPVLWVSRRIDHLAELACDEWALSISGVEPDEYAGTLVKVVRLINHDRQPKMGVALLRNVHLLESRLRAVLSGAPGRGARLSTPLKAALVVWLFFGLPGGAPIKTLSRVVAAPILNGPEVRLIEVETQLQEPTAKVRLKQSQREMNKASIERVQRRKQTEDSAEAPRTITPDSPETRQGPAISELTDYERGVMLARQFLQEKANAEKYQNYSRPQSTGRERDLDSKRAIELREQERLRHSF